MKTEQCRKIEFTGEFNCDGVSGEFNCDGV